MTKKDFFRLIIKLFGLYSIIFSLFSILPSSINVFYGSLLFGILAIIAIMALAVILFYFLIVKSDLVINLLKLDKGFDNDRIELANFNSENIIKLAAILLGGFLLIQNIPLFLIGVFQAFKFHLSNSIDDQFMTSSRYITFSLVRGFINTLIGYFLITNYRWLSQILDPKETDNS